MEWDLSKFTRATWGSSGQWAGQAGERVIGNIMNWAKANAKSCGWDGKPKAPCQKLGKTDVASVTPGKLSGVVIWLPALLPERNKDIRERRNGGAVTLQSMPLAQPVAASLDQEIVPFLAGVNPLPQTQPRSASRGISLLQQLKRFLCLPFLWRLTSSIVCHPSWWLPVLHHITAQGKAQGFCWSSETTQAQCGAPLGVRSTGNLLAETFFGAYASGLTDMDVLAHGTSSSPRMKNSVLTAPSSPPLI